MRKISIYNLLVICNIIFFLLMLQIHIVFGNNQFINGTSIILNFVLILENIIIILDSKKNSNPLLFLTSTIITFFYILRVITLNYTEYSVVFERYEYNSCDVNRALLYIIIALLVLWVSLHFSAKKVLIRNPVVSDIGSDKIHRRILIIIICSYIIALFSNYNSVFNKVYGFLTIFFFNIYWIVLASMTYYLYYKKTISNKLILIFIISLLFFLIFYTLSGSRSALYSLSIISLCSLISVTDHIYIKLKYILIGSLLIPALVFSFTYATFIRSSELRNRSITEKYQAINEVESLILSSGDMQLILSPIFDRIGFLDYATECITQKDRYKSVINPEYCSESIVDNILTPGFTVFDKPKMANSISFIYNNQGTPSFKRFMKSSYQSDEFTIFGEAFVMFGGWFSLLYIVFIGTIYKKLFLMNKTYSSYRSCLTISMILYSYIILFNSFGLDWFFYDVISLFITYVLFLWIIQSSKFSYERRT